MRRTYHNAVRCRQGHEMGQKVCLRGRHFSVHAYEWMLDAWRMPLLVLELASFLCNLQSCQSECSWYAVAGYYVVAYELGAK